MFADAPVAAGFRPRYPGEMPTLGYLALDWMTTYLSRPTVTYDAPFQPTREQAEFLLKWYQLDPITGERTYRRGVIQRSKGWGKAEGLDNIVPTPKGYRRFGDLRVGDEVYGSDGKPTKIVALHPVIEDYGYTIEASDGTSGVFHENHTFVARYLHQVGYIEREFSVGVMRLLTEHPSPHQHKMFIRTLKNGESGDLALVKFTKTERPIRMRCITVAAEDGQYLTGKTHWVTHNSPFLAAIAAFEALGPCRFAGWDANGRPVGMPWNETRKVDISLLAVSEEQTANAFEPMKEMMSSASLAYEYPEVEVLETQILLPFNGKIRPRTSSPSSLEGKPDLFTIADQTETWYPNNGGRALGAVAKRNLSKTDGTLLEAPNAFVPGMGSFAEETWNAWQKGMAGETFRNNILYDTRDWGNPDLKDPASIIHGLEIAYGDSLLSPTGCKIHTPPCGIEGSPYPPGWVKINGVLDDVFDAATTLSDASRFFGNKPHAAADAFLSMEQVQAATRTDFEKEGIDPPSRIDALVIGFDGSWGRSKGITDATAIVAMRVSDGLAWAIKVWEQPDTAEGRSWEPPRHEIDAKMKEAIEKLNIVDGLFDPSGWETMVAEWEALIKKKRAQRRVWNRDIDSVRGYGLMSWRGNQLKAVAQATSTLRTAIIEGEVMLTGSPVLTRHLLNAQYRETKQGRIMYKESPSSHRKIDAAYALMLAHQSRLRVLAKGNTRGAATGTGGPQRIR